MFEVVAATLVVGVMLVAALDSIGAVYQSQHLTAQRLTAPYLAHELMAEVLAMSYAEPEVEQDGSLGGLLGGLLGGIVDLLLGTDEDESTDSRADFDDVDDYDLWDASPPEDKQGIPYEDMADWRRQVSVDWIDVVSGETMDEETGLKRITVTVTSPEGAETRLTAYRSVEGMLQQPPALETTVVTWVSAELELSDTPRAARAATCLPNHATDVEDSE